MSLLFVPRTPTRSPTSGNLLSVAAAGSTSPGGGSGAATGGSGGSGGSAAGTGPSTGTTSPLYVHVELCKNVRARPIISVGCCARSLALTRCQRFFAVGSQVLEILAFVGRTLSEKLTESTWTVLLKVLMGATDALLMTQGPPPNMADELCPHLMRVRCAPLCPNPWGHGRGSQPRQYPTLFCAPWFGFAVLAGAVAAVTHPRDLNVESPAKADVALDSPAHGDHILERNHLRAHAARAATALRTRRGHRYRIPFHVRPGLAGLRCLGRALTRPLR